MKIRNLTIILKGTFSRWNQHEGQRLGAALAFYTVLAVAPLFVFLLAILSSVLDKSSAEPSLLRYTQTMVGQSGANLVATFLNQVRKPANGLTTNLLAALVLLFSASSVFGELRDDLNKMWDARPPGSGVRGMFLQKLFSFVLVLASGVVVLASMLATTGVSILARNFQGRVPMPRLVLETVNTIVSFAILSLVFALIYRFVPDCRLPWRTLWSGAAVSALLFVIGKAVLGYYLRRTGVGSAYGAAGSVIAFALWLYYSAQIFLLAAEFTYVWGKRLTPAAGD